jgi:hypothetical protein
MDAADNNPLDEAALRSHDDVALEAIRFELARDGDQRVRQVIAVLSQRAATTIVTTCRELGARRGVAARDIAEAIQDAQARVQMRLRQPERLPLVGRVAAGIARACIDAQPATPPEPPRLVPRPPELRLIDGLRDGSIRRNNPDMS